MKNTKDSNISAPLVSEKLFEKAKSNDNWKLAFATGKHAQIVLMSVSPMTNPKNEIGMETHAFDQVIIIVEGKGKTELDGKISNINTGDMIFIPEGTAHNVINLDPEKPLKLVSFYSATDIPANSVLKKKSDESE
jgi:quercetin dioxygenase-like cupin family protein